MSLITIIYNLVLNSMLLDMQFVHVSATKQEPLTVVRFSCSELVGGYFVSFHLTLVSSMSRVW